MVLSALLLSAFPAGAVTLSATGDIRLDGPVGEMLKRKEDPAAQIKGLLAADIVLGNLECAVTSRGTKTAKTWNFRAPAKNLALLESAGFTVVTVANNHVWDYGERGFLDTLEALEKRGLPYTGGGRDLAEAESVRIIEADGLRVGLLGLTSTFPQEAWAKRGKPGVAYSDFARLAGIVSRAKEKCDVLAVVFHGGTELAEEPNQIQKAAARLAVDSGADIFIGHHPHVLQAVEVYKGKPILYSLGNFLFVSPNPLTRPTAVARATLSKAGVEKLEFALVDGNWGRPRPAGPPIREAAFSALNRLGAFDQFPDLLSVLPPEIASSSSD